MVIVSHNELNDTHFNDNYKQLFNEQLQTELLNIENLSKWDEDVYYAIKKLKISFSLSNNLHVKFINPATTANYYRIQDKIPMNEDVFNILKNNNVNPKVLVNKIFYAQKQGNLKIII